MKVKVGLGTFDVIWPQDGSGLLYSSRRRFSF